MENQVSGPQGTGVCSPLGSSQSATEAVQGTRAHSRRSTATIHSHLQHRERNFARHLKPTLTGGQMTRAGSQSIMMIMPLWRKHTASAEFLNCLRLKEGCKRNFSFSILVFSVQCVEINPLKRIFSPSLKTQESQVGLVATEMINMKHTQDGEMQIGIRQHCCLAIDDTRLE